MDIEKLSHLYSYIWLSPPLFLRLSSRASFLHESYWWEANKAYMMQLFLVRNVCIIIQGWLTLWSDLIRSCWWCTHAFILKFRALHILQRIDDVHFNFIYRWRRNMWLLVFIIHKEWYKIWVGPSCLPNEKSNYTKPEN